ncbi:uncharacterized protein LOC118231544 [Anguilla anguilla]|uniref:uncharacterized protein LOC118231544 n=1 Tax=Anguilla anguilla TaxID=7936 RepID=UPI0015A98245|nr:uncharacterized protein LOC118231544 [Anguilla anguilla]XP_035281333.1 uncharacterized protein LOC118231544 [Anguilla anguilla]XP_035281334.1 uncharacterized protein LOC118231544 [Anguilla anguilla]XP_035281335.1 uncharacterized protein LOC118231544 [Anguilla anguilla]
MQKRSKPYSKVKVMSACVMPDKPPFTNTGVDYFGPFEVSRGRSRVKRYGVLFTCLTSRAVHIKVAHSLDTNSCINTLRHFMSRKGQVSVLRSDNCTNFIGAERELREALKDLDQSKIKEAVMKRGVKWIFSTPGASHHGGVWERQIQTARKVLSSLLKQQVLDDEGLQILLCEVESIINDRPITTTSDDPNDLKVLTPNHLLLMRTQPNIPPGVFLKEDLYVRRRWRQIQYMADLFWRTWTQVFTSLTRMTEVEHIKEELQVWGCCSYRRLLRSMKLVDDRKNYQDYARLKGYSLQCLCSDEDKYAGETHYKVMPVGGSSVKVKKDLLKAR